MKNVLLTKERLINLLAVLMYWNGNVVEDDTASEERWITMRTILDHILQLGLHSKNEIDTVRFNSQEGRNYRNTVLRKSSEYRGDDIRRPVRHATFRLRSFERIGARGGMRESVDKILVERPIILDTAGIRLAQKLEQFPEYAQMKMAFFSLQQKAQRIKS